MLTLEIVTPDGVALRASDLEVVVLRRREKRFEVGSEVAVFPGHAPMLVRLPIAPVRYSRGGKTAHVALCGGFAEVFAGRVTVMTPRCAEADVPGALTICAQWQAEAAGSREEVVGMPRRATATGGPESAA